MFGKTRKFLEEVKAEFKKVSWPTRDQTGKQTGVVLIMVVLIALFLGAVDLGLSELVKLVIG